MSKQLMARPRDERGMTTAEYELAKKLAQARTRLQKKARA